MNLNLDLLPLFIIIIDLDGNIKYLNKFIINDHKLNKISDIKNIYDLIDFTKDHKKQIINNELKNVTYNIQINGSKLEVILWTHKCDDIIYIFMESTYKCFEIKNTFMANLSHEVRSPLNGIIGVISLIQYTKLDAEQSNYLEMLKESSGILMNTIDNILDYSKLELGKLKLNPSSFYLRDCIETVCSILSVNAMEKVIKITYNIDEDVPEFIISDYLRIQQILINLLSNSIKFTKVKGFINVDIKLIKSKNSDVTPDYINVNNNKFSLLFTIKDSGSPEYHIKKEDSLEIFKSYHQLFSNFSDRNNEGTGLGLAICKELCNLMNGDIWVETEINTEKDGSTFCFTILVEKSYEEGAPIDYAILKNKHVLVVDDNMTNRISLSNMVKQAGMIPFPVSSSDEAMIFIQNDIRIDIGLLDIYLPRFTGVKLAQHIKITRPELPLIALSSLGDKINNIGENLFKYLIVKPANEKNLLSVIQSILMKKIEMSSSIISSSSDNLEITNINILIYDNDNFNRKVLKTQLKKLCYKNIDEVSTSKECIDIIKIKNYDIIFIDVKTGYVSGYDVIEYIDKHQCIKPYTICLSGYSVNKKIELFDGIMLKPINFDKLKEALEKFYIYKNHFMI